MTTGGWVMLIGFWTLLIVVGGWASWRLAGRQLENAKPDED